MKYEYHVPVFSYVDTAEAREEKLNELGKQGWYFVGVDGHGNHVFVRQRLLPPEASQIHY